VKIHPWEEVITKLVTDLGRRRLKNMTAWISLCSIVVSSSSPGSRKGVPVTVSEEIIALERSALDRWITFDPQGYLDLSASEVTYFDPMRDKRVDGLEALKALLEPIKQFKGSITEPRYEMIDPKVQQYGDVALLTYNLTNYGRVSGGPEAVLARWNSSELYARIGDKWKLVHSHWSFTKPDLNPPMP
jgi:ketosteroid isomerase-like protein